MLKRFCILLLCLMGVYFSSSAQSMEEGADILSSDLGLGIYNTTWTSKGNNNVVHQDGAADIAFIIGYEHGISDNFTFGVLSRTNILFLNNSQAQSNIGFGTDICVPVAFHFVRSEHVDLYLGADLGFSYLRVNYTDPNNPGVLSALGVAYDLDLGLRYYFNDKFAIHFIVGYSGYYYPNAGEATAFGGAIDSFSLLFGGSTYTIGVSYNL